MQTNPRDPDEILEQALALLDREQKAFDGHWIWDKLRCEPGEFFQAFRRHLASLPLPKAEWDRAYQKAQDELRIKTKEKMTGADIRPLMPFTGIKV